MKVESGGGLLLPLVLVHGGAGNVPSERRELHVEGCRAAARAGYQRLREGGSALDAVQAAVKVLEELPQFNAGTGSALNAEGQVSHDASLMRGSDLAAGAVGALMSFRNPIEVARAVLEEGRHVLYVGPGARAFAIERGFTEVEAESLVTEEARAALAKFRADGGTGGWAGGTVGAVAVDAAGQLAAGTSTGGTLGKRVGRLGDSPIIGAGTLADDSSCAVSCTGDGEAILKLGLSQLAASYLRAGESAEQAARLAVTRLQERLQGASGLILVTPQGRFAWARSTATMSFAVVGAGGEQAGI